MSEETVLLGEIRDRLGALEADVRVVKADVATIKADVKAVKRHLRVDEEIENIRTVGRATPRSGAATRHSGAEMGMAASKPGPE